MPVHLWCDTTIGEIVQFYDHKRVPLSSNQRKERQGPYPYYGASGIIDSVDDYLFDGKYLLIAEDGENLNSR
jgi:type I restriction enzyme S subunit